MSSEPTSRQQVSSVAGGTQEPEPLVAADPGLHDRAYLVLLLVVALLGIPLSLAAFGFLVAVHELEHVVWESLPSALGYDELPSWWAILTIATAGLLVGLAVKYLPGHGGHVPVAGFGGEPATPSMLPGVVLAAAASLVGGAVIGPEAPLIAIGGGLALVAVRRTRMGEDAGTGTIVAAAGAAAAMSAIFGNPLVAVVIFLEILGLGRRRTMLVVLPCLVSSAVGALLFTGMGRWTGLEIGELSIPDLAPVRLSVAEVAWAPLLAAAVACLTWSVFFVGGWVARVAASRPMSTTVAAGLVAGGAACAYAWATGHSPAEVALSGQALLPVLATDPAAWSSGGLVALVAFKSVAYGVSLGAFRGGPVFPAVLLGAACGVLASSLTPGIELLPGLAIGMAAGAATTGLPVTSVALVVLLLGDAAASQMPVVILAVVTAMVVHERLSSWVLPPGDAQPDG
ncbi:chloride channel protein [Nocardioides bizhenqiangii]|uniref:Chloride channel protein n=1 Tax=Nocardioides bizhenqiangii TaxID=3095076 RepID=A0ABZ0ZVB3_9ACTN|nr:chloride channel protein [Nocardioides sp. HM61]WQQ28020.1 chloride channel protein [Nocardioides sp. HM61]